MLAIADAADLAKWSSADAHVKDASHDCKRSDRLVLTGDLVCRKYRVLDVAALDVVMGDMNVPEEQLVDLVDAICEIFDRY